MVKRVRAKVDVPLVFMTYINPVYTYGTERFAKRCAECGIDGIIVPDVPFEEKEEVNGACEAAGIELISMIAPTSKERIDMIARQAKGFLYCVSSLGVTGVRSSITTNIKEMIDHVKKCLISRVPLDLGLQRRSRRGKWQRYQTARLWAVPLSNSLHRMEKTASDPSAGMCVR